MSKAVLETPSREDAILDAANRLLARYGYRKMTVDDLAQEAGIGKGTVYLHFKSKEDVVLSHVSRIARRTVDRLEAIAQTDAAPAEKIEQMLLARVLFRFDSVQHYTESISEVLRELRVGLIERRARHFEEEAKVFAVVLKEGQRAGVFAAQPPLPVARALVAATNSMLPFNLSTQELGKRHEVEQATKRIAQLLLHGLGRR